jgi:putative flippase GtrA
MKRIIKKIKPSSIREIFVYALVGGGAWGTQTLSFIIGVHFAIFPSVSMIIGNFLGMFVSYFGHTIFTFRKSHKFSRSEFTKFIVTSAIGFIINVGSVRFIIKVLELEPYYAIIPTVFTPLITFLINKFWAFK